MASSRRHGTADWLVILPLLVLVPAILVPFIATAGNGGNLLAGGPSTTATATSGQPTPSSLVPGSLPASSSDSSSASPSSIASPSGETPGAAGSPTANPTDKPTAKPTAKPTLAPPKVPGAVSVAGYGAGTRGGAGGRVIAVTNLNDSGSGSLRAALAASGPRIVVFQVGGLITLSSELRLINPYITIDGSTAPGNGIVIRNDMLKIISHDVIVRDLRLRPGDQVSYPDDADAVTLNGLASEVYNVVLDHLTMIWGPDIGGVSILGNVHDVTVQYSIMGEGLYLSRHSGGIVADGGHSKGASVFQLDPKIAWPKRITFHHDLFTTSDQRMPVVQGAECVDLVNNVIYNWGVNGLHGNPRAMNVVGNWFRSGPETTKKLVYEWQHHVANPNPYPSSVYLSGNVADGFTYAIKAPSGVIRTSLACGGLSVSATTAQSAYNSVLASVGATRPVRDVVDQRIIGDVVHRTGVFYNGVGHAAPNPYYP